MNIHFTDTELFNSLSNSTVHNQLIGSHLYGLNNENSDTDKLIVYVDTCENYLSINWIHHQLQFIDKDTHTDYNFCDLKLFVRNILTGDSTVSFETLWTDEFKTGDLSWMLDFRQDFSNYNMIKSYLGLAKRDLACTRKLTSNFTTANVDNVARKRLVHAARGIEFAKNLLVGDFSLTAGHNILTSIKSGDVDYFLKEICDKYEADMKFLRTKLQKMHDNKTVSLFVEPSRLKEFDAIMKSCIYDNLSSANIDYGNIFYNVMGKNVTY